MPKPIAYIVSVNGDIRTFSGPFARAKARAFKALNKAAGASVWMRAIL